MESIRIMPCLDMKDGRVVKGVHFVNLQEAGDPVQNAAFYQEEGADELAMLDIAATLENRKTRLSWVQAVSAVIDIPLTVGGGIGTLEDIEMVLDAGADKVSMNSAAVKDPDLVKKASEKFGKEKITIAIDGCRNSSMPSGFEVVVSGGTKPVGKDAGFAAGGGIRRGREAGGFLPGGDGGRCIRSPGCLRLPLPAARHRPGQGLPAFQRASGGGGVTVPQIEPGTICDQVGVMDGSRERGG
jgi:imidazoleglycerol phosphate synthase cyclase subunit